MLISVMLPQEVPEKDAPAKEAPKKKVQPQQQSTHASGMSRSARRKEQRALMSHNRPEYLQKKNLRPIPWDILKPEVDKVDELTPDERLQLEKLAKGLRTEEGLKAHVQASWLYVHRQIPWNEEMGPPSFETNLDELLPSTYQPIAVLPEEGTDAVIDVELEAGPGNPIDVDAEGSEHESQAPLIQSTSSDTSSEEDEEEDEDGDKKGDDDSHSDDDDNDDDGSPGHGGADNASNSSSEADEQFERDDLPDEGNEPGEDADMEADNTSIEEVEVVETMEAEDDAERIERELREMVAADPTILGSSSADRNAYPFVPPENDSLEKVQEDMERAAEEARRSQTSLASSSTAMPPPSRPVQRKKQNKDAEQANNSALSPRVTRSTLAKVLGQAGTYQTEEVQRCLEANQTLREERARQYEQIKQRRLELSARYNQHVDTCSHMKMIGCKERELCLLILGSDVAHFVQILCKMSVSRKSN